MKPTHGHKSINSALNGIINFQTTNYPDLIKNCKEGSQYTSKLSKIIRSFLKEKNIDFINNGSEKALIFNANKVQDNWEKFKNWILIKKEND